MKNVETLRTENKILERRLRKMENAPPVHDTHYEQLAQRLHQEVQLVSRALAGATVLI